MRLTGWIGVFPLSFSLRFDRRIGGLSAFAGLVVAIGLGNAICLGSICVGDTICLRGASVDLVITIGDYFGISVLFTSKGRQSFHHLGQAVSVTTRNSTERKEKKWKKNKALSKEKLRKVGNLGYHSDLAREMNQICGPLVPDGLWGSIVHLWRRGVQILSPCHISSWVVTNAE